VLADFGVAHAVSEAKDERITRTGTSLGTPAYMSPEQAMGELDPDGRTDQYALGCVLFEMLAGHPPFTGAQVEAVVRQHLTEAPPSVTQARPTVTEEVVTVLNRSLAKSPADRFRTTGEMAAALALTTTPAPAATAEFSLQDRPLWQILAGWAVASLVIFAASGTLRDVVGLPSWVPAVTGLICLGALPLVIAAARKGERKLPWRVVGFAVGSAFAFFVLGTGVYMGMRVLGIGPVGTLVAQGVVEDQARLLVADLSSQPEDSLTASGLSEGLRIGLSHSDIIRVVNPEELRATLQAMRLPAASGLTETVAREAAVREGIPLVLVGELTPIGTAYQLTARVIDPDSWTVHLSLRERAGSVEETLDAADRMVGTLRERIGESLHAVQNRTPLVEVTTSSLPALKIYTQAVGKNRERDFREAADLLEDAVVVDPMFAGAWRLLGIALGNLGTNPERRTEALTRAFELSDRLPEPERLLVAASYHQFANIDYQEAAEALELLLERYPDRASRNNLGVAYGFSGELEKARDLFREDVNLAASPLNTQNLIGAALRINDLETARWALQVRQENQYDHGQNLDHAAHIAYIAGDRAEARRHTLAGVEAAETSADRATDLRFLGRLDALEGRLTAFRQRYAEANRLWAEVDATNSIFSNRLFLVWMDAIVLEQPDRARARLEEALLDPDLGDPPPTLELAYALASLGMTERAREALIRWEAATPEGIRPASDAFLHLIRGWIALWENRMEEGLREIREADRASFGGRGVRGDLARVYDGHGMADSALVAHRRYLDAPNNGRRTLDPFYLPAAYERLGQLHEERGEVEEAIKYHTLFVELWAEADPELQPRVEAARAALARLQGGSD
jgi:tetratricopeptide (TPR) repeat protein